MASEKFQSRYLHLKSILPVDRVTTWIHQQYPDASIAYATHDDDPPVHTHYIVRFQSVTRWKKLRDWLQSDGNDPHSYSSTARSWPRSIRYLIHLDNPEKTQYPREHIKTIGIDSDELAQLLQTSGADYENIFRALADTSSMQTGAQFLALVRRGFRPSEITAVARCLAELEKFGRDPALVKQGSSSPPLPSGIESEFDFPLENESDSIPEESFL